MTEDEQKDRLIDMLLSEHVGGGRPPDVRERVLQRAESVRRPVPMPARRVVLASARRSKLPALATAALIVLSVFGVVFFQMHRISSQRSPSVVHAAGQVSSMGPRIDAGQNIATGPDGAATLQYLDGTTVELGADTRVTIMCDSVWDRSKMLELVSGSLRSEIAPQIRGSEMVFRAGSTRAVVLGTTLSLKKDTQRTRLEVSEGRVRFVPEKGKELAVEGGHFAENGPTGVRSGMLAAPGISGFTLMDAETDRPIRELSLIDVETISLASLPTRKVNIRADHDGAPATHVVIKVERSDRGATGLPPHASDPHKYPPYFVAGDHWAEGRPEDCAPWTPPPGIYQITAEAFYQVDGAEVSSPPVNLSIRFTP